MLFHCLSINLWYLCFRLEVVFSSAWCPVSDFLSTSLASVIPCGVHAALVDPLSLLFDTPLHPFAQLEFPVFLHAVSRQL